MEKVLTLAAKWFATFAFVVPAFGGAVVSFSAPSLTFSAGQTLSVNLKADLPDPVLGYGIDVEFNASKLLLLSFSQGALWFPIIGSETDDVAGIAFPTPVSGSGILLGTLSFKAITSGTAILTAAFDPRNLAEGFPLASGGFATSNLIDESPQPPAPPYAPEPSTFALCGLVVLVLGSRTFCRLRRVPGSAFVAD